MTELKIANTVEGISFVEGSTNYGYELIDGCLVTSIGGIQYKMCWIGSGNDYIRFEVKPNLRDDISFKEFEKAKAAAGENWRTDASVLTLLEGVVFDFFIGTAEEERRYGHPYIRDTNGDNNLIGLIPIDYKYYETSESWWNDWLSEYEVNVTKKAIPA